LSRLTANHELQRELGRLKSSLESESADRRRLDELRRGLEDQLDAVMSEHRQLQTDHTELQRLSDLMEQERDDLCEAVERQRTDNEKWFVIAVLTMLPCLCFTPDLLWTDLYALSSDIK